MNWDLVFKAFAFWSIAASGGIIIAAPHNDAFGKLGAIMMIILLLGLILAAGIVAPEEKDGMLGFLIFIGGLPAYMAGVFYAMVGMFRK